MLKPSDTGLGGKALFHRLARSASKGGPCWRFGLVRLELLALTESAPCIPRIDDGPHRPDVRRRRAATAADHADTSLQQFGQALRHLLRCQRIDPAVADPLGRPGIRPGEDRFICYLAIPAGDFDDLVHANIAPAVDAYAGYA